MGKMRDLYNYIFPKKIRTIQLPIIDKKIHAGHKNYGIYMYPSNIPYLYLEKSRRIKVDIGTYNRIKVGDSVWVSEYSNGSFRLSNE